MLKRPLERDLKVPEAKTQYSSAHNHLVKDKSYKGVRKAMQRCECSHSHVGLLVYKIVSETRLSSYFGFTTHVCMTLRGHTEPNGRRHQVQVPFKVREMYLICERL
jgi:hypothetical protein